MGKEETEVAATTTGAPKIAAWYSQQELANLFC